MEEEVLTSSQNPDTNAKSRLIDTNVIGQPRTEPVRVPAFLKGGRPNATTNERVIS